jgi:hypothetical protein
VPTDQNYNYRKNQFFSLNFYQHEGGGGGGGGAKKINFFLIKK